MDLKEALHIILNYFYIYVKANFGSLEEFGKVYPKEKEALVILAKELARLSE